MLSTPNSLHTPRWPRRARPHTSHDPRSHNTTTNAAMPSSSNKANGNGSSSNSHFPQKLKNFFRISNFNPEKGLSPDDHHAGSSFAHTNTNNSGGSSSNSASAKFRQSKFFASVGRLRSTTTTSEGHPLDAEALSPTANANPYFAHQGPPALRHHNDGSVPPSPPDTPELRIDGPDGPDGSPAEQPTAATKEELARKLRRVASAPNAQGLFSNGKGSGERPATAELGKEPLMVNKNASTLGLVETKDEHGLSLSVPDPDGLSPLPTPGRTPLAFRRTYSSNSIKVRNVEVGPSSFDKIKLIGKGDVGKVYLVKEKKSSRLYAMKGSCFSTVHHIWPNSLISWHMLTIPSSAEQEGDDQAQQDQESSR